MAIYATDASGKRVKVAGGGGGSGTGNVPPGGTTGQVLAKASDTDYDTQWTDQTGHGGTAGVSSFNGRTGAVTPQAGDYTAAMVGAVPAGQGGVGRSMAGETVKLSDGTSVTAGTGAEIFNSYENSDKNLATGKYSHAEGLKTTSTGYPSHAEGDTTVASGDYGSHAEGNGTIASDSASHAEGKDTSSNGLGSHSEGIGAKAEGSASHAEGYHTVASGFDSHAEGSETVASGQNSHAAGEYTIASGMCQFVVGRYNVEKPQDSSATDSLFIVGGGLSSGRGNAFRVEADGKCYGRSNWNSSGADYAELFEWLDGNPEHEDRAGLFVTLEGERIHIAGPEDGYILGIVSASPSVVGDVYDDQWQGMHIRDVFGRIVYEMQDFPARTVERPGPDGKPETVELTPAHSEMAPKINPEYDNTVKYQPRTQRPEWDAVGLMGKLVAVDDGACQPDGWAKVGPGGKATASAERTKYRVMARLDDTHIKIMIL